MMGKPWNVNTHYHELVHAALPRAASCVLDVGCGEGVLTAELADHGRKPTGVDVDEVMIQRARALHGDREITWMRGDVMTLPLEPGTFDAVVSVAVLHHLDAAAALRRFAELVRPSGTVVVVGVAANSILDVPLSALAMLVKRLMRLRRPYRDHGAPICWPPPLSYKQVKALSQEILPGSRYHRLLLDRFCIVWQKP